MSETRAAVEGSFHKNRAHCYTFATFGGTQENHRIWDTLYISFF